MLCYHTEYIAIVIVSEGKGRTSYLNVTIYMQDEGVQHMPTSY